MTNKHLLHFLHSTKFNFFGNKVKGKYIVIESDDWGAIRTPSKEIKQQIEQNFPDFSKSPYAVDGLASSNDLDFLFNELLSFKDFLGNHPKFTANVIVANPDFQKIKESEFNVFHFETIDKTFNKLPSHSNNLEKWKEAERSGVFIPQFHGREHLNYFRWLKSLRESKDYTRYFFDFGMTYSGVGDYSFMEAFDWSDKSEIEDNKKVIKEGLVIFESLFGKVSKSFIAPCYNWDPDIEDALFANSVKWIQGTQFQLAPTGIFNQYRKIKHNFGDKSVSGIRYSKRNVFFEPTLAPQNDWVNNALARISNAFLFHKPAVICSHRINYVGFIDENNRDRNLKLLNELLKQILKRWPDVRFISSQDYDEILVK